MIHDPTFEGHHLPRQAGRGLRAERFREDRGQLGAWSRLEALIEQRSRDGSQDLYEEARRELDRSLLPLVLRSTEGNQLQAVRILGIAPRTLRLKLRELGLSITRSVEGDKDDPA
jgi:DNA-binding NtrC family response regulator